MRWGDFRSSDNVDDRRGGGGLPGRVGGLGIGATLVLGLIGYALGIDPRLLIGAVEQMQGGGSVQMEREARPQGPPTDEKGRFVTAVLGNTEDVWRKILPAQTGRAYVDPKLVMFSGATRSRCGPAHAAMGPFYCPLDQTVYIDLTFFEEMRQRFRAGGDFAYAYVIAHEVGHHVEHVLGILPDVQRRQREVSQSEANRLSVRVELMADCLAGVWAHHSNQGWRSIEEGDVEEAMAAAAAIGDDRLQRQSQGRVVPDSFTHGTSEQRMRWFMTGLKTGQVARCDTFRIRDI